MNVRSYIAKLAYQQAYGLETTDLEEKKSKWLGSPSEDIQKEQLRKFNVLWKIVSEKFSLYQDMVKDYRLPNKLDHISQIDSFPILDKDRIKYYSRKTFEEAAPCQYMSTGGSTGDPLSFPVNYSNAKRAFMNAQLGRSANFANSIDRKLVIWGHSHLISSTGIRGSLLKFNRQFRDVLSNTYRVSAYDLSATGMKKIEDALIHYKPQVLISYASVIRALAQTCEELEKSPDVVVATAEQVLPSDFQLVENKLGCTLVSEYGLAEFGPVAYTTPDRNGFVPFWESFYSAIGADGKIFVTDLDNVAFPFINYCTNDLALASPDKKSWAHLKGRANDLIIVPEIDGLERPVHSEFLTHVVKSVHLRRFNVEISTHEALHQDCKKRSSFLSIHLECNREELPTLQSLIVNKLFGEFPLLDSKRVLVDSNYHRRATLAGKEKFIIDNRSNAQG